MKVLERNKNIYVLEPLRQYLVNEGIDASIMPEWKSGRRYGPYVLVVDDASFREAMEALNNIDGRQGYVRLDPGPETDNPITRLRERLDIITRWIARIFIAAMILLVVYYAIRFR
ncbi:MAG: hypothetical protein K5886_07180 [Lachnospiraceae bacterium]|nr:hypothetical protein [Lachnospiraceae bacterium]